MTKRQAAAQARREISRPYKTAANPHGGVTWGLSTTPYGDKPTQSDIGTYREAVAARAEWIATRIAELTEGPLISEGCG